MPDDASLVKHVFQVGGVNEAQSSAVRCGRVKDRNTSAEREHAYGRGRALE